MFYARQGGGGTLTVFMCYGMNTGSGAMGYTLNNIHVLLHKFSWLLGTLSTPITSKLGGKSGRWYGPGLCNEVTTVMQCSIM